MSGRAWFFAVLLLLLIWPALVIVLTRTVV